MTGKELILNAFKCGKVDRIPWVPFCGVHSASLINKSAKEYLQSSDLMIKGLNQAVKLYNPDGFPAIFDLQIEAEIFGCELNWSDDNPPAVISHPVAEGKLELKQLKQIQCSDGRIPLVLETIKSMRKQHNDKALYGLITGPFTLALHLLGTDIFMSMFDKPEYVKKVLDFTSKTARTMSKFYLEAGCDIIAVVDPMTSQIGPEQFREFCKDPTSVVFDYIRECGGLSSFFVCGHAQNNIEAMCECNCDNISIDENIALDYVKNICLSKGISFGGNMKLTSEMLLGTPETNSVHALECMEIGGFEGFILAPGCDMPYAVPKENVIAVSELVKDPYKQEVAKEVSKKEKETCDLLDMSDYGNRDKVVIDIITLDSEGCAPCQYMVEAVKDVVPEFGELVEWREHKIKDPESITVMSSLLVKNIPTICIDGKIKFVSTIPPRGELINAIQKRIREKFTQKTRIKHGKILLLGNKEDENYKRLSDNLNLAKKEIGGEYIIEEIDDSEIIKSYGVFRTPAVLLEKTSIKSEGRVTEKAVLKEWLKEL